MRSSIALAVALAGIVVSLAAPVAAEDARPFKVVVHPATPVTTLTVAQVSQLFLRTKRTWDDGVPVAPVDQLPGALREAFSKQVFGRSVSAIKSYWQSQLFAGRGVPPPEVRNDAAVVAHVTQTPGAIGYVSADAPVGTAKVVVIAQQ